MSGKFLCVKCASQGSKQSSLTSSEIRSLRRELKSVNSHEDIENLVSDAFGKPFNELMHEDVLYGSTYSEDEKNFLLEADEKWYRVQD